MMRSEEVMEESKVQIDSNYAPQIIYSTAPKITSEGMREPVAQFVASEALAFEEETEIGQDPFIGANRLPAGSVTLSKEKLLGSGAFGQVFQEQWGERTVALKEINIKRAQEKLGINEEEVLEALQWEISRLSTLSHANLVQFYGLYEQEGRTYLVMEFCEGGSLQRALETQKLDWSMRWQWALEIAQGLAYLHHQGVLHRDLKAENILLDKHQRVRLADLGVAQVDALLQHGEAKVVAEGFRDQHFIAPETHQTGASNTASDIYALGLVFWQLATQGKKPRCLSSLSISTVGPWEHEAIPADCPPSIKELILDCWQLNPAKRPQAGQIVERLNHLATQFHPSPTWIKLCEKADTLIHPARSEILKYIAPYATQHPVIEDLDAYWSRLERLGYQERESKESQEELKTNNEQMLTGNLPLDLTSVLEDFLQSPESSTLLLLGEAGLGKTLSTYQLADKLLSHFWEYLKSPRGPAPYYPLLLRPMLNHWSYSELNGVLRNILETLEISLNEAELHRARWLLIIDGYDECQIDIPPNNLPKHLGLEYFPNAKLLITCRPNAVPALELKNSFALNGSLTIRHFLSFKIDQMLVYLKERLHWNSDIQAQYQQKFQESYTLRAALRNPFVLSLLVRSWETVRYKDFNKLNRWQIYERFIEHWIKTRQFLLSHTLKRSLKRKYSTLLESFNAFAANIAFNAFNKGAISLDIKTAIEYSLQSQIWINLKEQVAKDSQQNFFLRKKRLTTQTQRRALLNEQDYTQIMLWRLQLFEADSPLKNRIFSFDFTHKSFFEYFMAKRIIELRKEEIKSIIEKGLELLNHRPIQLEPEALRFINEAWQESDTQLLMQPLFQIIEHSKHDSSMAQASANAATLLNACCVSFSGLDLRGVHIPGADLSYGIFDKTQLQGANLKGVDLEGAWLREAKFNKALMSETRFGQWPILGVNGYVHDCCYSCDGHWLAIANGHAVWVYDLFLPRFPLVCVFEEHKSDVRFIDFHSRVPHWLIAASDGRIISWNILSRKKIQNLSGLEEVIEDFHGFREDISSVTFSPDGKFIAISAGHKIYIWEIAEKNLEIFIAPYKNFLQRRIKKVGYLADNNHLAFSIDDKVKIINLASGEILKDFEIRCKNPMDMMRGGEGFTLSDDSRILASGVGPIDLWDIEKNVKLNTLEGHNGFIYSLAFSPDGSLLASASQDKTVKLWDVKNGVLLKVLQGHTNDVISVTFSPNGRFLVSGSEDCSVRTWDVDIIDKVIFKKNIGHQNKVNEILSVSNSGKIAFISSSKDKTIRLWALNDLNYLTEVEVWKCKEEAYTLALSSDKKLLATGHIDGIIRIWELKSGNMIKEFFENDFTSAIKHITFISNRNQVLSIRESAIKIWDIQTTELLQTLVDPSDSPGNINSIAISPAGNLLATGSPSKMESLLDISSPENIIKLWDISSGLVIKKFMQEESICSLTFSGDGLQIISGSGKPTGGNNFYAILNDGWGANASIRVWDIDPGILQRELFGHTGHITVLKFSPCGEILASGGYDRAIRLWCLKTGKECGLRLDAIPTSLCWKIIDKRLFLISAHEDASIRCWKVYCNENNLSIELHWISAQRSLNVELVDYEGVRELSIRYEALLKQLGGVASEQDRRDREGYLADEKKKADENTRILRLQKLENSDSRQISESTSPELLFLRKIRNRNNVNSVREPLIKKEEVCCCALQ